jgi:hypothetical protein
LDDSYPAKLLQKQERPSLFHLRSQGDLKKIQLRLHEFFLALCLPPKNRVLVEGCKIHKVSDIPQTDRSLKIMSGIANKG